MPPASRRCTTHARKPPPTQLSRLREVRNAGPPTREKAIDLIRAAEGLEAQGGFAQAAELYRKVVGWDLSHPELRVAGSPPMVWSYLGAPGGVHWRATCPCCRHVLGGKRSRCIHLGASLLASVLPWDIILSLAFASSRELIAAHHRAALPAAPAAPQELP